MAFPIGTHVVINGLSSAAEAAGTVVGYTTFEDTDVGDEETTRPTRHHHIVELDDEYQVFLGDTNVFVKHIPVHEDYLRRSRGSQR